MPWGTHRTPNTPGPGPPNASSEWVLSVRPVAFFAEKSGISIGILSVAAECGDGRGG